MSQLGHFGKGLFIAKAQNKVAVVSRRRPPVRKEIKNVKKSIRKIQSNDELKHNDTSGGLNPATAGNFRLLNGVAQSAGASTDTTRIGDDVNATSIQLKGYVQADGTITSSSTDVARSVRVILFWDQQANGGTPTLAQLLDLSVVTDGTQAPYNDNNQKRFKILKDKIFAVNPFYFVGATNVADTRTFLRFKWKLSRKVKYIGTTGLIASIGTNALWLVTITDSTANANQPVADIGTRFIFKD